MKVETTPTGNPQTTQLLETLFPRLLRIKAGCGGRQGSTGITSLFNSLHATGHINERIWLTPG